MQTRLDKEKEKEQIRNRIASDLHDEIGSNLSSIIMLGQVLDKTLNLQNPERERLLKIPGIARKTAESMRDIVWFINPENDSFEKLLTKMRETANVMLEGIAHSIEYTNDGSDSINDLNFRRNLFLVYKEILHNIVSHALATEVKIRLNHNDHQFSLIVVDNGVGFNPENEFKGNGLRNYRYRANEMKGEIVIQSRPGHGTRVALYVKIP